MNIMKVKTQWNDDWDYSFLDLFRSRFVLGHFYVDLGCLAEFAVMFSIGCSRVGIPPLSLSSFGKRSVLHSLSGIGAIFKRLFLAFS